jgi:hypothetical protein
MLRGQRRRSRVACWAEQAATRLCRSAKRASKEGTYSEHVVLGDDDRVLELLDIVLARRRGGFGLSCLVSLSLLALRDDRVLDDGGVVDRRADRRGDRLVRGGEGLADLGGRGRKLVLVGHARLGEIDQRGQGGDAAKGFEAARMRLARRSWGWLHDEPPRPTRLKACARGRAADLTRRPAPGHDRPADRRFA